MRGVPQDKLEAAICGITPEWSSLPPKNFRGWRRNPFAPQEHAQVPGPLQSTGIHPHRNVLYDDDDDHLQVVVHSYAATVNNVFLIWTWGHCEHSLVRQVGVQLWTNWHFGKYDNISAEKVQKIDTTGMNMKRLYDQKLAIAGLAWRLEQTHLCAKLC